MSLQSETTLGADALQDPTQGAQQVGREKRSWVNEWVRVDHTLTRLSLLALGLFRGWMVHGLSGPMEAAGREPQLGGTTLRSASWYPGKDSSPGWT